MPCPIMYRRQTVIKQDADRLVNEAQQEQRQAIHSEARTAAAKERVLSDGFNPITGQTYSASTGQ